MAQVIEITCPGCERTIKVPESAFGKKLKCKHCGEKIEVEEVASDEDEKPKKQAPAGKVSKPSTVGTSKPGGAVKAKTEKEAPKPAPPPPAAYKMAEDDDEGDGGAKPNPLGVVDEGEDIPRCPHCAKELDPPDAVVCIHCGFNNMTRAKAESKTTWAPSGEDWFQHLLPGVLALIGFIILLVLNIMSFLNMRDWMTDTILMKDGKGPDGEPAFWVKPGAFITFILAATIMPLLGCARFAIKRLIIENKPEERVKT
jgi:hypothetical protein